MSQSLPEGLEDVVEDLVEEKVEEATADLREENEQLRERVDELEDELEDQQERMERVGASISRLINTIRERPAGEGTDANDPSMVVEAANVADELYDTMERARQNAGLLDFREKRPETASITEKYLNVLGRAEEKAEELDSNTVYLNYREVANKYGCAYKNDGYRVMEEMDERVPGVEYVDGRDLPIDTGVTHKIEEKTLRVEWQHPDLRGWVRAHRSEEVGE